MTTLSLALTKTLGFDVQAFVEKAVEGYWMANKNPGFVATTGCLVLEDNKTGEKTYMWPAEVLLDPAAWRAVGKVEGWKVSEPYQKQPYMRLHPGGTVTRDDQPILNEWEINMHRFLDALIELDETTL